MVESAATRAVSQMKMEKVLQTIFTGWQVEQRADQLTNFLLRKAQKNRRLGISKKQRLALLMRHMDSTLWKRRRPFMDADNEVDVALLKTHELFGFILPEAAIHQEDQITPASISWQGLMQYLDSTPDHWMPDLLYKCDKAARKLQKACLSFILAKKQDYMALQPNLEALAGQQTDPNIMTKLKELEGLDRRVRNLQALQEEEGVIANLFRILVTDLQTGEGQARSADLTHLGKAWQDLEAEKRERLERALKALVITVLPNPNEMPEGFDHGPVERTLLEHRKGPPRSKAAQAELQRLSKRSHLPKVLPGESLSVAAGAAAAGLIEKVAPSTCKVRVLRRTAPDASGGFLGLKAGLTAGENRGLDWQLVVLSVEHLKHVSIAKICRDDIILRVGHATTLADMIQALQDLDSSPGSADQEVEVEIRLGKSGNTDTAMPVGSREELLLCSSQQSLGVHSLEGHLSHHHEEEFPNISLDEALHIEAYTPVPGFISEASPRIRMLGERMRRAICSLRKPEALSLLRIMSSGVPRSGVASPNLEDGGSTAGGVKDDEVNAVSQEEVDLVEQEVSVLSQTLLLAAGEAASEAGPGHVSDHLIEEEAGGPQLWMALVEGVSGAPDLVRNKGSPIPLTLLWREALFRIGFAALAKRSKDIEGILSRSWSTGAVNEDWKRQLGQIDETLGWVAETLNEMQEQMRQAFHRSQLLGQVSGEADPSPETENEVIPHAARERVPERLPAGSAVRWAKLEEPARLAVRELQGIQKSQNAARNEALAKAAAACRPKKAVDANQLLSFDTWRQGPAGCGIIAKYRGELSGPLTLSARTKGPTAAKQPVPMTAR